MRRTVGRVSEAADRQAECERETTGRASEAADRQAECERETAWRASEAADRQAKSLREAAGRASEIPDSRAELGKLLVSREGRSLRCGFTTGTCATGAAVGAVRFLLQGTRPDRVCVRTPAGVELILQLEDVQETEEENERRTQAAVRKDAGDDPDVTDGMLIYACARKTAGAGICLKGGTGIGRVTLPGLAVPVGEAAVNPVPGKMIMEAVREIAESCGYEGGLEITLFAPEGEERAARTFNPRLGIQGGISILGTTGIVEPMSERAVLESLRLQMRQQLALGTRILILVPGNYGETFLREMGHLSEPAVVKCGNYIGEAIDLGLELGAEGILFAGHLGKFVKLAGGIMNTHSHQADCRMELLCASAIRAGGEGELGRQILQCRTTREALTLLDEAGLTETVMKDLLERIQFYLDHHAWEKISLGAVVYVEDRLLGCTKGAEELLRRLTVTGSGDEKGNRSGDSQSYGRREYDSFCRSRQRGSGPDHGQRPEAAGGSGCGDLCRFSGQPGASGKNEGYLYDL